jgi:hypothetical protein
MIRLTPRHLAAALALAALAIVPARAETIGGNPGPAYNYVCPHADGKGPLACFLDAVEHLYTMCRNVKSIEILTYGYEDSLDGVNAAKYESCVEKQKHNMDKPYRAALSEVRRTRPVSEALRELHDSWLAALAHIRWNRGESDTDYKARVATAYDNFRDRIAHINVMVAEQKPGAVASAQAAPAGKAKARTPRKAAPAKGSKNAPAHRTLASDQPPPT